MTLSTLISLACALTNRGNVNTNEILGQLTDEERAHVQEIVESGACLPENMEILIKNTKDKNIGGGENVLTMSPEPCDGCF